MGHTGGGKDDRQLKRHKHDGGGKKMTTAHIVEDADSELESDEEEDIKEEDNKVAVNVLEEWVMITTTGTAMDKAVKANLYDSGASRHISPFRGQFITYCPIPNHPITVVNNHTFNTIGTGDIAVDIPHRPTSRRIILKEALYAPNVRLTIISISCLLESGYEAHFKEERCFIMRGGSIIGSVPVSKNGLFKTRHAYVLTAQDSTDLIDPPKSIRTLMTAHSVMGLRLIDDLLPFSCDSCDWAKTTCKHISKHHTTPQATHFGVEIHSDVWGPSAVKSINNRTYYVSFTDDYSCYSLVAILRTKDEAFMAYKSYVAWAQTQHGVPIQRLRLDRGGEYLSFKFTKFLQEQGMEHRLTTANTPEHNGVAEALN